MCTRRKGSLPHEAPLLAPKRPFHDPDKRLMAQLRCPHSRRARGAPYQRGEPLAAPTWGDIDRCEGINKAYGHLHLFACMELDVVRAKELVMTIVRCSVSPEWPSPCALLPILPHAQVEEKAVCGRVLPGQVLGGNTCATLKMWQPVPFI